MEDPLPELHAIELAFHPLISKFYEEYPEISEDFISKFIQKTAEYSRELNISLKTYAKIDYFKNKSAKIAMKASIKFTYDVLSLLTSIIKYIESDPIPKDRIESQIRILENLIDQKKNLISTTFYQAASQELLIFYDKNLRSNLEAHMHKRLENKKSEDK